MNIDITDIPLSQAYFSGRGFRFDPHTGQSLQEGQRHGRGFIPARSHGALAGLEPPRFCPLCGRRMKVQVHPMGWNAECSRHGDIDSADQPDGPA